jgi:hypothetical protein
MPRDKTDGDSGPALVLFAYGLTIMTVGAVAFNEAELSNGALSAIFVGNGGAVIAFGCAAAVREHGKLRKGDPGWREYMLGIHAGLVLPALYSVICVWRGVLASRNPEKDYIVKYMALNVFAGILAVSLLLRYRVKGPGGASVETTATDVMAMASAIERAQAASGKKGKVAFGKKGKVKGKSKTKTT